MYDSVHKTCFWNKLHQVHAHLYSQAIGKPTNLKDLAASKSKNISRIAKLGKGYLCKREIDLREII